MIIVLSIVLGCIIATAGFLTAAASGSAMIAIGLLTLGIALSVLPILRIEAAGRQAVLTGIRDS
jgi:hypothetical protein